MVMGSSFDHHRGNSPSSSVGGTPTPTSSSNSAPQPQVPSTSQENGGSSWIKQQVHAIGANIMPGSGTSQMLSQTKGVGSHHFSNNAHHNSNGQRPMQSLTSQDVSFCGNGINREPRLRGDSPDEGIQVESDV